LGRIPLIEPAPSIERRASRISDPVERLRYLRRVMPRQPRARRKWVRHVGLLAFPAILVFAPRPHSSGSAETVSRERKLLAPPSTAAGEAPSSAVPRVWRVDHSATTDIYSNGLRIDLTLAVANRRRADFNIYSMRGGTDAAKHGNAPVGIIYHTTESHMAPFAEEENRRLKQLGRNLVEGIRRERAYHYVIDRFGRVFNVVLESDAANHAGYSGWADDDGIYVNLNDSFIGVSFEGQTDAADDITPAQIAAARVLTQMLRSRYEIRAENCVTHAQVSVNPSNMRMGAHTDWGAKFPFTAIGLPDNYALPPASIYVFGFEYDSVFLRSANGDKWSGLALANARVEQDAAAQQAPVEEYRATLRRRYKEIAAALKKESEGGT
jgi:hypothetical protein